MPTVPASEASPVLSGADGRATWEHRTDRSRRSRHKLAPYFRMGVKEAWTWDRKEGASLWRPDATEPDGFRAVPESRLCPGLDRDDLDRLCARGVPAADRARLSRRLARRVAEHLARTLPASP